MFAGGVAESAGPQQPLLGSPYGSSYNAGGTPSDQLPVPNESRQCTDVFCAVIFIIFALCFVILGVKYASVPQVTPSPSPTPVPTNGTVLSGSTLVKGGGIALLLGGVNLLVLYLCSGVIVWVCLLGGLALLYIGLGITIWHSEYLTDHLHMSSQTVMYMKITIAVVAVILTLVIFFCRKRIAFTIKMIQQAVRSITHNLSLIPAVLFLGLLMMAALGFLCCTVYGIGADDTLETSSKVWLNLLCVFGGFWVVFLIAAITKFTISGAVLSFMFQSENGNRPGSLSFLFLAFTKSFGTLAFGSFILALIAFIKWIQKQIEEKTEKEGNVAGKIFCCIIGCLISCCLSCVQWINSYAYCYSALHGYGFTDSAHEVFGLLRKYFGDSLVMDSISGFVFFISNVGASVGAFFLFSSFIVSGTQYGSFYSIVTAIFTFAVCTFVTSLLVRAAEDALLVGVCVSEEKGTVADQELKELISSSSHWISTHGTGPTSA